MLEGWTREIDCKLVNSCVLLCKFSDPANQQISKSVRADGSPHLSETDVPHALWLCEEHSIDSLRTVVHYYVNDPKSADQ